MINFPSLRRRPSARRLTSGFTLVEMLVVMAIIVVLLGLTTAAIRGMNGGANRRAAVATLMGVFDQARMLAISDGRSTYVVFASAPSRQNLSSDNLTPTDILPGSMWGRAYALFEDKALTDSMTTTDFYPEQRSAWMYLPSGVAFKCDSISDSAPYSITSTPRDQLGLATPDPTAFKIRSMTSHSTKASGSLLLPYVKFDSTGQIVDYTGNLVDPTSPSLRLLLFEGTASVASSELYTHQGAVRASVGDKKFALDEILLKSTTGRAAYTLDPLNNYASPAPAANAVMP